MGHVLMPSIVKPLTKPVNGLLAGDFAVGSVVKLMEGGVATDYLVVNQGIPSGSSLYDASCDGTWLLRKDVYENQQYHSSKTCHYPSSDIKTYLDDTFFNRFGSIEQTTIKQVNIPYNSGSSSGNISTKVFLMAGYEVGLTGLSYLLTDGAKVSYFESGDGTSAKSKRIAYLNGSASRWWLRSKYNDSTYSAWHIYIDGASSGGSNVQNSFGVRPAVILPSTAVFDKDTLILKGVA